MKKWKCSVCGYIHEGDEPPEECPICGADRSQFVELPSEESKTFEPVEPTKPTAPPISAEPVPEAAAPKTLQKETGYFEKYKTYTTLMAKFHAHPIAVHIPNGVLPVVVCFLFLSMFFQHSGLEAAAFYNLVFVVISMPAVILTGVVDWKTQFRGALTRVFKIKITCAAIVSGTGLILVLWKLIHPEVTAPGDGFSWVFVFILMVMLAAAVTAGYFGGKLVFKKKS
jgi:rubredoxin